MTVRFDNNLELRKEFEVKKPTLKYTQPSEAKFSAIMDVLNGYIIGGFRIIGNLYKFWSPNSI